ncbi:MAG: flagellar protein FliS [Sphingomonadaceae bacterium]
MQTLLTGLRDPGEAYRRSEVDARIAGASPVQLVVLCCEQVSAGITAALRADRCGDRAKRSAGVTRALSALTALEMGIAHDHPFAGLLMHIYGHARTVILDSVTNFDHGKLKSVQQDFVDLAQGFRV